MRRLGRIAIAAGAGLGVLATGSLAWALRSGPADAAARAQALAPRVETGLSGTATGIGPGLLLTNSHVVRGCQARGWPIRIPGLAGGWTVRHEDPAADLALLAGAPDIGNAILPVSGASRVQRGTPVAVLGFPAGGGAGGLRMATGQVLRAGLTIRDPSGRGATGFILHDRSGREIQPSWEDGVRFYGAARAESLRWTLEVDALVPAGSSGGPMLDAAGNLVGIIFAGDEGRRLTSVVPLDDVREFLARAGVHPRFGARATGPVPDWHLVDRTAAQAVYQVRC